MIGEALVFLKNQLNDYLKLSRGHDGAHPDPVGFVDGEKLDPLTFETGIISVLLINMEEENTLRAAEPFRRTLANGTHQHIQPDIRLNLYVLFVARFSKYEDALHSLSLVIRYFQHHRLFTHADAPGLSENIERLVVELATLPFAQQNEIWSALRVAYHPSVLYKVKMVVFQDEDVVNMPEVSEKVLKISV
jgi:hypothetical protein